MPYPRAHNYLVCYGETIAEGQRDVWQLGLRIGSESGTPVIGEPGASLLNDVEADLTTFWTAFGALVPASTRFLGFKFNGIGPDGRYLSQERTVFRDFAQPKAGQATADTALPPQCAVVATLRTGAQRGLAAKGRIYLPSISKGNLGAGGYMSDGARDNVESAVATLLTNLNNWPGLDAASDPGDVVVASKVGVGAMRKVTGVSVGRRLDVQRSRGNKLQELRDEISPVS